MKHKHPIFFTVLAAAVICALPLATAQSAKPAPVGKVSLQNASLADVIAQLARQLHINYTLDPAVKEGMTFSTYGDTSGLDARSLLDQILRINGAALVQKGEAYRIVPAKDTLPPRTIHESDQPSLSLIVPKYRTVDDLAKELDPGENATIYTYSPANLLFILDSRRNMRRIMDSVALLDSDKPAPQARRNTMPFAANHPTVVSLTAVKAQGGGESVMGADMGGGFHGCLASDTSPSGTVKDGYKKTIMQTPFGQSCHWEQAK